MSAILSFSEAYQALVRAQAMPEAIRALAEIVQSEETDQLNPFLAMQAIIACTESIDALVDPLVNAGRPP